MKVATIVHTAVCVLLSLCAQIQATEALPAATRADALRAKLTTKDKDVRFVAKNHLLTERNILANTLIQVAKLEIIAGQAGASREIESRKTDVYKLLGHYRVQEACALLVVDIEFSHRHVHLSSDSGPLVYCPAAKALLAIGSPAVKSILSHATQFKTAEQRKIAAYVIKLHYAGEEEVGLFRLERAAARCTAPSQSTLRDALQKLIAAYKAADPEDRKDWPRSP